MPLIIRYNLRTNAKLEELQILSYSYRLIWEHTKLLIMIYKARDWPCRCRLEWTLNRYNNSAPISLFLICSSFLPTDVPDGVREENSQSHLRWPAVKLACYTLSFYYFCRSWTSLGLRLSIGLFAIQVFGS